MFLKVLNFIHRKARLSASKNQYLSFKKVTEPKGAIEKIKNKKYLFNGGFCSSKYCIPIFNL